MYLLNKCTKIYRNENVSSLAQAEISKIKNENLQHGK